MLVYQRVQSGTCPSFGNIESCDGLESQKIAQSLWILLKKNIDVLWIFLRQLKMFVVVRRRVFPGTKFGRERWTMLWVRGRSLRSRSGLPDGNIPSMIPCGPQHRLR